MEHDVPFGNSNRENGTTFLDFPLFLGIFQWDEPTKRVPFTAELEIPEILTKWKAPYSWLERPRSRSQKQLLDAFRLQFPSYLWSGEWKIHAARVNFVSHLAVYLPKPLEIWWCSRTEGLSLRARYCDLLIIFIQSSGYFPFWILKRKEKLIRNNFSPLFPSKRYHI